MYLQHLFCAKNAEKCLITKLFTKTNHLKFNKTLCHNAFLVEYIILWKDDFKNIQIVAIASLPKKQFGLTVLLFT